MPDPSPHDPSPYDPDSLTATIIEGRLVHLSSRELLATLRSFAGLNVVGAEIVEVGA